MSKFAVINRQIDIIRLPNRSLARAWLAIDPLDLLNITYQLLNRYPNQRKIYISLRFCCVEKSGKLRLTETKSCQRGSKFRLSDDRVDDCFHCPCCLGCVKSAVQVYSSRKHQCAVLASKLPFVARLVSPSTSIRVQKFRGTHLKSTAA